MRVATLDHAVWLDTNDEFHGALYRRAGSPKKLVIQRGVRHYESYRVNYAVLMPIFVDWYRRFLVSDAISVIADDGSPAPDQAVVQRYLTTKDEASARKAIWVNAAMPCP